MSANPPRSPAGASDTSTSKRKQDALILHSVILSVIALAFAVTLLDRTWRASVPATRQEENVWAWTSTPDPSPVEACAFVTVCLPPQYPNDPDTLTTSGLRSYGLDLHLFAEQEPGNRILISGVSIDLPVDASLAAS